MADAADRRRSTTSEVAAAFRLRPATVQLYARQGRIPFGMTPGGHRRFDIDEVGEALGKAAVPRTSTLRCPKCGYTDTSVEYCDGCMLRPPESIMSKHADDYCRDGDPEHFHRACRQCRYRWKTDDVINPRVVCSDKRRRAA